LGIGYIASYTEKVFPNRYQFELFTNPDLLIKKFLAKKPLVIGFRNDIGNSRLSYDLIVRIKKRCPEIIIVIGGPNWPVDQEMQFDYIKKHKFC